MNKIILISIGAVIVVGIVMVLVFRMLISAQPNANAPAQTAPTQTGASSVTTGSNPNPPTPTGATTQTLQDRVKSDSATVKDPINKNTYYLGYHPYEGVTDPTASDNPPYLIAYDDSNQSFTISLLQEPLAATRSTVESYLMTHFSLTQDQMCSLRYIISTPYRVNQVYAGTNLGFSFCAGATKL